MREPALEAYLRKLFELKHEVVVTPQAVLLHFEDLTTISNFTWFSYEWERSDSKYIMGRKIIPYKEQKELKWLLILYG